MSSSKIHALFRPLTTGDGFVRRVKIRGRNEPFRVVRHFFSPMDGLQRRRFIYLFLRRMKYVVEKKQKSATLLICELINFYPNGNNQSKVNIAFQSRILNLHWEKESRTRPHGKKG
eukprot:scaffold204358_cov57-Attheya_sp.AAC.4